MIACDVRRLRTRGFTLIELLVVMAITTILLGLIFGPMVQGFNLTNQARVQVLAQDTARRVAEVAQRETGNGVFVFDNSNTPVYLWVKDASGNPAPVPIPYGMIDLVPPARENDQNASLQSKDIDPTTGLAIQRGPISLPVAPGRVIVRYFLGLRDNRSTTVGGLGQPAHTYVNYYEELKHPRPALPRASMADHNPTLLYRAVFSPYLPNGQVDTRLINMAAHGNDLGAALRDPNFFYDANEASGSVPGWQDLNGDGKVQYFENWAAVAQPVVPSNRADEVEFVRNAQGAPVLQTMQDPRGGTMNVPQMVPLAKFQPTYVGNDDASPSGTSDTANGRSRVAPSAYVGTFAHWTFPYRVYVIRGNLGGPDRYFSYEGSGNVFYNGVSTGLNPDTLDPRRLPAGTKPYLNIGSLNTSVPQLLMMVDERRGLVNCAFPEWVYRHDATGAPVSPATEPVPFLYDTAQANAAWTTTGRRTISLLTMPNGDANPLFDLITSDTGGNSVKGTVIVPGSEVIIGPDMRPGPHQYEPITYTRVQQDDPSRVGPNQYRINYTQVANASSDVVDQLGTIVLDSSRNADGTSDGHDFPSGTRLSVTFQVQNNFVTDVVKTDYLTRQMLTFALTVKLYEQNTGLPQQVTLTQKIRVRNLQR